MPWSTFKMVVGLAALEAGVISSRTKFFCGGSMTLGTAKFHCWRQGGHGSVDIIGALEQSCDVFFYEIALKTGIKNQGYGKSSRAWNCYGLNLPGERPGIIPSHEWKLENRGRVWTPGETVVAGSVRAMFYQRPCN